MPSAQNLWLHGIWPPVYHLGLALVVAEQASAALMEATNRSSDGHRRHARQSGKWLRQQVPTTGSATAENCGLRILARWPPGCPPGQMAVHAILHRPHCHSHHSWAVPRGNYVHIASGTLHQGLTYLFHHRVPGLGASAATHTGPSQAQRTDPGQVPLVPAAQEASLEEAQRRPPASSTAHRALRGCQPIVRRDKRCTQIARQAPALQASSHLAEFAHSVAP
mmetsp:Transcript_49105/g.142286  ORF Transcript_49105/g.142286 Transcript_49105/m.142286 type:complete len:222 (+) Transcript_49105:843-1508(+)